MLASRGRMWPVRIALAIALSTLPMLAADGDGIVPQHLTHTPELWANQGRPDPAESLTLTFALRQQNLDVLERKFWEVSHPDHPSYGKYFSLDEMTDLVGSHPVVHDAMHRFLEKHGVAPEDRYLSPSRDFLEVTVPVHLAERMLKTTFNVFEHKQHGVSYIRAITPHRATEIEPFVDFIGGLTHLPDTVPTFNAHAAPANAAKASQTLRRRLAESVTANEATKRVYPSKSAAKALGNSIPMANPLAWRGTNITVMTFFRCKDGSVPKAAYDCPEHKGLRTLRMKVIPTDKRLKPVDKHYSLDGNIELADTRLHKYITQIPIDPYCRPCTQMPEVFDGVGAYSLCHEMVGALGIHPYSDVLACLFTFPAKELMGKEVTVQGTLFYEEDSPEPASVGTACIASMSDFACTSRFTPQPPVTPKWLHHFYSIPAGLHGTGTLHGNAMAAVEFLGQGFDPADLQRFFKSNGVPMQAIAKIIGTNSQAAGAKAVSASSNGIHGASVGGHDTAVVDLEVMMSVAPLVPMWYWSVPGRRPSAAGNNEPFLRWLLDVANTKKPPLVHSVSYSDDEGTLPRAYSDRLNTEFMKAALRGVTILFTSGVDGAGGVRVRDIRRVNTSCKYFRPQFPSSSPYITSVGSTAVKTEKDGTLLEIVSDAGALGVGVSSGGGFSNRYLRPLYQAQAVKKYLSLEAPPPQMNPNGTSKRGYPDLAAIAPAFQIEQRSGRSADSLGGTSAATPTVAAMIALLNDVRLAGGLPPLGFVNPLFYSLASSYAGNKTVRPFRDVTTGNNRCSSFSGACCPKGFSAAVGWDATSGVGSPNFAVISGILGTYLGACLGMDCGGGTCSRGVCICNDGFHRNGAGRCIALAPFPLKALLTACGAIVGIVTLCIVWKSCSDSSRSEGGRSRRGGKKSGKKKGFFYQLRKTIFPYKFVIVKAADKKKKQAHSSGEGAAAAESQPIMTKAPAAAAEDDYGMGNGSSYDYGGGSMGDDYNYGDDAI